MAHEIFDRLEEVIARRRAERPEGSYTTYLFSTGQDKILKKVGEEVAETIVASKNGDRAQIVAESADLLYHLLVLLAYHEIPLAEVEALLRERHGGGHLADSAPRATGPG